MPTGLQDGYRYEQIARDVAASIRRGDHRPGTRLPSIDEMAASFGVSTITVRRALKELVADGLVVSRQGNGSFVRDRRRILREVGPRFDGPRDFASDIRRAGLEPGVHVLDLSEQTASTEVAERLGTPRRGKVWVLESLVLADGVPIARDRCFLPPPLYRRFSDRLGTTFVISLLLESGVAIGGMDLRIGAEGAADDVRSDLDVPRGFPLLTIGYTPCGEDRKPLLTGEFTSRSDRLSYRISR